MDQQIKIHIEFLCKLENINPGLAKWYLETSYKDTCRIFENGVDKAYYEGEYIKCIQILSLMKQAWMQAVNRYKIYLNNRNDRSDNGTII